MITNAPTAGAPPFGTELRDIKPPLVIPTGLEWLWWTLGMLAALAVLYFVWRWWRQPRW